MKGKEDHEYMLNILLKENEKYRNTLKEQSNNKSETIYGTILAMLDVLSIQRNKIDSIEKENKKLTKEKEKLITQLKEEEMKSRSRSFYKTTSNNNTTRKNENSKSVSMSHLNTSSIKTKMYVPGEKLKQSKNKIKLLSSQPLIHNNNKNNNEQINNSLKHLEYNYENLMALSLKGMNSIQAKPKQSSNINNK